MAEGSQGLFGAEEAAIRKAGFSERSFRRMSQELWDLVVNEVPSLTGRHAAEAFNFKLEQRHKRPSGIWSTVLKPDEIWTPIAEGSGLNPFLAGYDLHKIGGNNEEPLYIALLTGDETGNIRYSRDKLLCSLRPHDLRNGHEIVFHESNIVMNVVDAVYSTFFTTLAPERLFGYEDGKLRSACLYWKDPEYAIRPIESDHVVGIGGKARCLQDISNICGITFTYPDTIPLLSNYQKFFVHPECPPAYPLYNNGGAYNRNRTLGWQWGEDRNIRKVTFYCTYSTTVFETSFFQITLL
jgi:hypothetical protein